MPKYWDPLVVAELHPGFWEQLRPLVESAHASDLMVRFLSGYRSNEMQGKLYRQYLDRVDEFKRGVIKRKPLPAAPPGNSAHNFSRCAAGVGHFVGDAEGTCPQCGAAVEPSAVAVDIWIPGPTGKAVKSGGAIPYEDRPVEWQKWADLVATFPKLRDGGLFRRRPDSVHVEWARWDFRTKKL
jgi:hypothetical protein